MIRYAVIAICLMAGPAWAQTPQEAIFEQLQTQGYTSITANRTWLGRTRVIAQSDEFRREIVFNPASGEILRDYWVALDGDDDDDDNVGLLFNPAGTDGADTDDVGDDHDDDDDDDHDDDDSDEDDDDDDDE